MKHHSGYTSDSFSRYTHARIFTDTEEHAVRIQEIMKTVDADEMYYYPEGLVTYALPEVCLLSDKECYSINLVNVRKFDDMDLNELQLRCLFEGIPVAIWRGNSRDEYEYLPVNGVQEWE